MARILKEGKLPGEAEYDLTCKTCHTIARFKRKDGRYMPGRFNESFMLFTCPFCSSGIGVSNLERYLVKDEP